MAQLVYGFGTSHSPQLNLPADSWHLRGEAGARQVEGAKAGLAHVIGLGSACTIHILKK